jgi:hypothetical protein
MSKRVYTATSVKDGMRPFKDVHAAATQIENIYIIYLSIPDFLYSQPIIYKFMNTHRSM